MQFERFWKRWEQAGSMTTIAKHRLVVEKTQCKQEDVVIERIQNMTFLEFSEFAKKNNAKMVNFKIYIAL